jgi:hypothetical protein
VLFSLMAAVVVACVFFPVYADFVTVPPWVVAQVPARMKLLQPGMTHQQVWQQLGLDGYRPSGQGNGPSADFRQGYKLWPGCGLYLVFDRTAKPERLKRAKLVGSGWIR